MRVAIVGSGVSGLVAARQLHQRHEVTIFEAGERIGGHVHTWSVESGAGRLAIDSGFIVYNERNYPNFTRLLAELAVPTQPSTMSFSVRHDRAGVEYNGSTLRQMFVHKRNLVRPAFLGMIAQILRFNRESAAIARSGPSDGSLRDLLAAGGYSTAFRDWYLLPMGSALWSIPAAVVLDMETKFFVDFFHNHGMLTVNDRPQWRVVRGGSARYVEALVAPFRHRIRLNRPVRRVTRRADFVDIDGDRFDRVVLAGHADQSLALLRDPSRAEREVLGALPYQPNEALVHTDTSILPRARFAWGAWNYRVGADPAAPAVVTYNMNILQSLTAPETYCVTLNGAEYVDPSKIVGRALYHHPIFTRLSTEARARRAEVSGPNRTHYCGAYWGNGFHEDGVASGLASAREVEASARVEHEAGVGA